MGGSEPVHPVGRGEKWGGTDFPMQVSLSAAPIPFTPILPIYIY